MDMFAVTLLFAVGLILLIKGGDWFVDGACGVAHRFHLPEILIGATIVSIGTTLPEVMVTTTSAVKGISGIAYGNAIGSVICNTALIPVITVTVRPSPVGKKTFELPVIFFFIAAAFYECMAYIKGGFTRWSGFVLLGIFAAYMLCSSVSAYKNLKAGADAETVEEVPHAENHGERKARQLVLYLVGHGEKPDSIATDVAGLIAGAAVVALGAELVVDNGTLIAEGLGVPDSVIGLTFIAVGTSLPELTTAITSLVKGHSALSLGNDVGANLFNLVLVSGLAAAIAPFDLPVEKTIAGMNASLVVDSPLMLFVMAFTTIPALVRGTLTRAQGIILLSVYAAFCPFQFFA